MTIRSRIYPWDLWLNGEEHCLIRGEHFPSNIEPRNFRTQFYLKAKQQNIKVSGVIPNENTLIVQAILPGKSGTSGTDLVLADRRAALSTKDERNLIEKHEDELELTENILDRLNNKNEMELVRGRDYDISDFKLARAIYNAAARQGVDTSRWKYERTKCGIRFYVEEVNDKLDRWVSELADIPEGTINREIVDYKIYFKDPTGFIREQKPKYCSFCGNPVKEVNNKISYISYLYKKVDLKDLTIEEGRPKSSIEKIVLKRVKDFVGTPINLAEKIRNAAIDRGINIDDWEFVFENKNELTILCGSLAEKYRDYQLERKYIKLMAKKMNDPPSQNKIEEWVDVLAEENWLQIKRGVDYFCPERVVLKWISEIAVSKGIKIGSYIPESKIGDSDGYGMTFSTRKALPVRFKALEFEKPIDTMKRMEELGYGYVIDQPFVNQRLEVEEKRQLKDTRYARKVLEDDLNKYRDDIKKVKAEGVRKILQEKIREVEYELNEVVQIEEQRKLENLENKNVE